MIQPLNLNHLKREFMSIEQYLVENYHKETISSIADKFLVSERTVLRKAKFLELTRSGVNENFFDVWNPESAYVFGFFLADGNISYRKGRDTYRVSFSQKDSQILYDIRRVMGMREIELKLHKNGVYDFSFTSDPISDRLLSLETGPNKSVEEMAWPEIPDFLVSHFLRGLYDGDGGIHKKKEYGYIVYFCADVRACMAKKLQYSLSKLGLPIGHVHVSKNMEQVNFYSMGDIRKILSFLYKDASLYLRRKYFIYEQALSYIRERKGD